MFCPSCRDEFRSGFTRCDGCGVDLVHELPSTQEVAAEPEAPIAPVTVVDYCGYLGLDEAREARDKLRGHRITSDIVIREAPGGGPHDPVREEYWLRVDRERLRQAHDLLGSGFVEEPTAATEAGEDGLTCSECGHSVADDATSCPGCGARFDE